MSLQTHVDESVESLRVRAQKALGVGKGRLLDSTGSVLDGGAPLKKARKQFEAEGLPLLRSWEMAPSRPGAEVKRVGTSVLCRIS